MKKKLIYICSPCRGNDGNYEHNIEMAQYYCRTVMHMFPNLLPIAPHVYFTQFLDDSDPCERRMGMVAGMELLEQCSEVWVFGMENPSAGMKKEIAKANELGIPIVDAAEALTIHSPAAASAAISASVSAAAPLLRTPELHPDISVNAVPFPDVADIEEQHTRFIEEVATLNMGRNNEGYPDPTAAAAIGEVAKAERSARANRSRLSGQYFEGMITASLNWYRDMGVAYIEKTPEPMKPLRAPNRQGQFLACFTKQGQPDFKGTLTGGRSVVFEAKHTDDDKIEYGRLTHEQIEALSQHHKLGAAAFVLVSIKLENFYRIPWTTWRDMKQIYGRKHIKQAELEPFRLQYISGVIKMLEGIEISYTEEGDENEQ